jgi:hypothetical protein
MSLQQEVNSVDLQNRLEELESKGRCKFAALKAGHLNKYDVVEVLDLNFNRRYKSPQNYAARIIDVYMDIDFQENWQLFEDLESLQSFIKSNTGSELCVSR